MANSGNLSSAPLVRKANVVHRALILQYPGLKANAAPLAETVRRAKTRRFPTSLR